MRDFDKLMASRSEEMERAQVMLDEQQLKLIDKIRVYDVRGSSSLSPEELFDWFLATKTEEAVRPTRSTGYTEIDYFEFKDIPAARKQLDITDTDIALQSLEPSRRGRKQLGRQAVAGALGAMQLAKTMHLGNPAIPMVEYEMDPENLYVRSGDSRLNGLERFIDEWDEFRFTAHQPPEDTRY